MSAKLARVALAAGLVLLVLLVGEWLAGRIDGQASFRKLHVPHPGAPWLYDLVPGATAHGTPGDIEYHIAAHGFRDHPRTKRKAPGVFRIAILGDSVAFGYGVAQEDGFVARLEKRLAKTADDRAHGRRVEVLNFGVSGFNPYNEAELFRGVVRDFEPDLTLVQFCVNDLNDPRHHFGASTLQHLGELPDLAFPNPDQARRKPVKVSKLATLCDRSALCRILFGRLLGPARVPEGRDELRDAFEIRTGRRFATEWSWLRGRYADLASSAHAAGSDFGVLVFPSAADLQGEASGDDAGVMLREMGREEGWLVIDLLPAFRDHGGDAQTLFLYLWHPTAAGHALAAKAIADELRSRKRSEHTAQGGAKSPTPPIPHAFPP